jgi:MFS family permease
MKSEETKPEIARGRSWAAVVIVVGHMIKHLYGSGFQTLILPQVKIDLGLSLAQFGLIGSVRALSWWFATMASGYLGDRFTGRTAIFLGITLVLIGLSQVVVGFVSNYWILLASMLLLGGAPAMFHPFAIGELSRRFPDRRGFAISMHGMGGMTGEVLGPLVVAAVLAFLMWRDVLKLSFFPAIIIAFTMWIVLRSLPRMQSQAASKKEYFASMGGLLRNPMFMILVISTGIRGMGESAVDGFLPVYLKDTLEYSDRNIALVFSGAQVIGLLAQPVMGFVSDRFGRKVVLIPATISIGVLSLLLSVADPGIQVVLIILAKGTFKFSLHHIFIAAAIDASGGKAQSTVTSFMYGAGLLGILSPYIAGLISDNYGIHAAFVFGGVLTLLAFVVLIRYQAPKSDAWVETPANG